MKTWVKVSRAAASGMTVRVTVQDGNLSATYTIKTAIGQVKADAQSARSYAIQALRELQEATTEQEEAA
jgi:hypothetical protein